MSKLKVFNFITANGFFKGPGNDTSWHQHGPEQSQYSVDSLSKGNTLVFGRVTYQMMEGFWSTPEAAKMYPDVALGMNRSEKIVFSRTLGEATWNNTTLISGDVAGEIAKLKAMGKNMAILGSGSIVTQCAEHDLIDEYELMIDPVIIGNGTPIFKGITHQIGLNLTGVRTFPNGVVLLSYKPA